jgi:hypothetical protein
MNLVQRVIRRKLGLHINRKVYRQLLAAVSAHRVLLPKLEPFARKYNMRVKSTFLAAC